MCSNGLDCEQLLQKIYSLSDEKTSLRSKVDYLESKIQFLAEYNGLLLNHLELQCDIIKGYESASNPDRLRQSPRPGSLNKKADVETLRRENAALNAEVEKLRTIIKEKDRVIKTYEATVRVQVDAQAREAAAPDSRVEELQSKLKESEETVKKLEGLLKYYTNPNTPPSANSLEWKVEKRLKKKERQRKTEEREMEGEQKGDAGQKEREKPAARRGGKPGHKGTSRRQNPERTVRHKFRRKKINGRMVLAVPCECGKHLTVVGRRSRNCTEIKIIREEVRHVIEVARCESGHTVEAPSGLPEKGNFGKNVIGLISELRAERVTINGIKRVMGSAARVKMAESTIVNILANVCDKLKPQADEIRKKVEQSPAVGFDESRWSNDGDLAYVNVAQSGQYVSFNISRSRAMLMLDMMSEFKGIATADGFPGYSRFDEGGRYQTCWAHLLRITKHLAKKYGAKVPTDVKRVREDLYAAHQKMYRTAKTMNETLEHSPRLRQSMNDELQKMLDGYRERGKNDPDMIAALDKLQRQLSRTFAFLEFLGVDPTNNASERALRYMIVFRKISGQTKGGPEAMARLADFASCVVTWRNQGKSVYDEIVKLV